MDRISFPECDWCHISLLLLVLLLLLVMTYRNKQWDKHLVHTLWPSGDVGSVQPSSYCSPSVTQWAGFALQPALGSLTALCNFLGECSITGQSHFKSFDNKHFTFSGICQYLFAKDCVENSFSVIIETVQVTTVLAHACVYTLEWAGRAVGVW